MSQYWLTKFVHRQFPPPLAMAVIFSAPSLSCYPTMSAAPPVQVRCPGCERDFTPRSLSQHVSKSQDLRCCRIVATSQSHRPSVAFPRMTSPPTLTSNWASQVVGEDVLGDEQTQGKFAVTCVAAHEPVRRDTCCCPSSCRLTKELQIMKI
jgi:hypothetical protein